MKHLSQRELSAYLDGEARHPERIASHLAACTACEGAYQHLVRMSAALRNLPEPEVRPEFATRVMAHVREVKPMPRRLVPRWLPLGLAAIAIAAIVGSAWFLDSSDSDSSTRHSAYEISSGGSNATSFDAGMRLDEALILDGYAGLDDWTAEAVEPIVTEDWTTPLVEAWGPRDDLDSLLMELDASAEANFRDLLWLYAQDPGAI